MTGEKYTDPVDVVFGKFTENMVHSPKKYNAVCFKTFKLKVTGVGGGSLIF